VFLQEPFLEEGRSIIVFIDDNVSNGFFNKGRTPNASTHRATDINFVGIVTGPSQDFVFVAAVQKP
jgi:hypothetical protein